MENTPLRILLADDDESDRLLFKEAFGEMKIKTIVHTVDDGAQLMDYLAKNKKLLPHLLFLDLNMPRKNGMECLKEIRINKKLKDISIAIYSTSSTDKDIDETFVHGANVYIKKPNDFSELKQVLEKAVLMVHLYENTVFNRDNFLLQLESQ
jgi:CheY-like chemotaxis protein